MALQNNLSGLRDKPAQLAKLFQNHGARLKAINDGAVVSIQASQFERTEAEFERQRKVAEAKQSALSNLGGLESEIKNRRDDLSREINEEFDQRGSADQINELTREMREQRAWAGVKTLLDATENELLNQTVDSLVREFVVNLNDDAIAALRYDGLFYFRARYKQQYGEGEAAETSAREVVNTVEATLAELKPDLASLSPLRQEVAIGVQRLFRNVAALRSSIMSDQEHAFLEYWNGDTYQIEMYAEPKLLGKAGQPFQARKL